MLGERLPKVPAGVPPLPETPPDGLTVREITERHRKDSKCAGCHIRIDPFGMTLEQFDALGRLRPAKDMKPGDAKAITRDGVEIDGFAGLRDYLAGFRSQTDGLRVGPRSAAFRPEAGRRTDKDNGRRRPVVGCFAHHRRQRAVSLHSTDGHRTKEHHGRDYRTP